MTDFNLSLASTTELQNPSLLSGTVNSNNIMGMSPASFASIGGMLAQAIAPPDSGVGRIGAVASALGQTQIKAMLAQKAQKDQQSFLKDLLGNGGDLNKMTPEQAKAFGLSPSLLLGASPSGATGLETGKMTPGKISLLDTPSFY